MYKVVITSHYDSPKEFATVAEVNACITHLAKIYRSFDIYKDGELVGTGDRYGVRTIRKRKRITGSVGYAQMMSEKR